MAKGNLYVKYQVWQFIFSRYNGPELPGKIYNDFINANKRLEVPYTTYAGYIRNAKLMNYIGVRKYKGQNYIYPLLDRATFREEMIKELLSTLGVPDDNYILSTCELSDVTVLEAKLK